MCNVTHSYVWRDAFICVTWLLHVCDMTHSYVWRDSFIRVPFSEWHHTHEWVIPHIWMSHITHTNESYYTYERVSRSHHSHSYTWHNSSMTVTRLIDDCDMTHSYARYALNVCVTWRIHVCSYDRETHSYMWHNRPHLHVTNARTLTRDIFVRTRVIHIFDAPMNHSYMWHNRPHLHVTHARTLTHTLSVWFGEYCLDSIWRDKFVNALWRYWLYVWHGTGRDWCTDVLWLDWFSDKLWHDSFPEIFCYDLRCFAMIWYDKFVSVLWRYWRDVWHGVGCCDMIHFRIYCDHSPKCFAIIWQDKFVIPLTGVGIGNGLTAPEIQYGYYGV